MQFFIGHSHVVIACACFTHGAEAAGWVVWITVSLCNSADVTSHKGQKGCIFEGIYHQITNINSTLVGNKIVDHWEVAGAEPVQLHLHSLLNIWPQLTGHKQLQGGTRKKSCFGDLVGIILEVWWYCISWQTPKNRSHRTTKHHQSSHCRQPHAHLLTEINWKAWINNYTHVFVWGAIYFA